MASTSNGVRNTASLAAITDAVGQHDNAAAIANPAEINFVALSERVLTFGEASSASSQNAVWSSTPPLFSPRRPLRRAPRRALPRGAFCARRRVLHPSRVEGRARDSDRDVPDAERHDANPKRANPD